MNWLKNFWNDPPPTFRGNLQKALQRLVLAARLFYRDKLTFRASSLTFSLLFAIVPIFAIIFAVAKGFGLNEVIEEEIRRNFSTQPQIAEALLTFIRNYLLRTRGGFFLGFGILLLLWTLFWLTDSVETTLNEIWRVERSRTFYRKVIDYATLFFLLPLLILISSGVSVFLAAVVDKLPRYFLLHTTFFHMLQILPYLLMILFFLGFYLFIPNTSVKFKNALSAAIPVGFFSQLLQHLYLHSQIFLSGYNAIYGSFAALPLIMLWLLFTWYLILFGAELTYVSQNPRAFLRGEFYPTLSKEEQDYICLHILSYICKVFHQKDASGQTSLREIAEQTGIPFFYAGATMRLLEQAELIHAKSAPENEEKRYAPSLAIEILTPAYALARLRSYSPAGRQFRLSKTYADFEYAAASSAYGAEPLFRLDFPRLRLCKPSPKLKPNT